MVEAEGEFKEVILGYVEYQASLMYMLLKRQECCLVLVWDQGFSV